MRQPLLVGALACGCAATPVSSPVSTIDGTHLLRSTGQHFDLDEAHPVAAAALATKPGAADAFAGKKRVAAKTSIAIGSVEAYSTIVGLRASLMPDAQMRASGIHSSSPRTPDEERNVSVGGVIYAISKETDNDFHLIVGDRGCRAATCIMNVEVSGLPLRTATADFATLSAVRQTFLAHFSGGEPGAHGFETPVAPVPVTVTGSLFFDVDHAAGAVGPPGRKPSSVWEIHPVTEITFEP